MTKPGVGNQPEREMGFYLLKAVEQSRDGIVVIDLEGNIQFVNRAWTDMFGVESVDLLGKGLDAFHSSQSMTRGVKPFIAKVIARGHHEADLDLVRKSRERFRGSLAATLLHNDAGEQIGILAIIRDVTEYEMTKQALAESEEHFRSLLQSAEGFGIVRLSADPTDPTGYRVIFASPSMTDVLGSEEREFANWLQNVHPEDLPDLHETLRSDLAEAGTINKVVRYFHPSKGLRWIQAIGTAVKNEEGSVAFFNSIVIDITDWKATEEELRQNQEKYSKLFQFSSDVIFIHDLEGRILDANQAAINRLGYARAELLSRRLEDMHPPEAQELHRKAFETVIRKGIVNFEINFQTKDGRVFPAEVSSSMVEISGQQLIQGIVRDISERKRIEEQFRASQRMESVGRLAGGIAHDFNNLLGAITGYSDLALRAIDEDKPLRRDLEEISKAANRAADLTKQLLAFSRKQVLEPKVLDLNALIHNLEKMLRRLIGEDVELITSLNKSLGSIKADPAQIEQVIMNLAVNSRDAMPDGGKLILETNNTRLDEDYADRHLAAKAGDHVMLAVTDTGMGMDEATRSRIFEPFFTTKPVGKGTGLGLSTVYGIVQQSGGTIWVYSNPGKGSTFKVYFPLVSQKPEEAEEPLPVNLQGSETILVVEDEKVLRRLIRRMLASSGYTVLEAAHGSEALQVLDEREKPIDLLLTDVVMPNMGGKKLAERLSGQLPGMKILYMSGYTDNAIVHQGVLDEGVAYIQKPFSVTTLVSKVRKVLDEP